MEQDSGNAAEHMPKDIGGLGGILRFLEEFFNTGHIASLFGMFRAVAKKEGTGIKSKKEPAFRDQTEPCPADVLDRESIGAEEMEQRFIVVWRNGQAAYDRGNT